VNAEVTLVLVGGETLVAIITNSSIDSLGLKDGTKVYGIIKANEVIVGKAWTGRS
jgi:molybdate transport system regulatory protein